jgi:hypothetical protein
MRLAPQVGLEPTTLRLTAECSAIELLRNDGLAQRSISRQARTVFITNRCWHGQGGITCLEYQLQLGSSFA